VLATQQVSGFVRHDLDIRLDTEPFRLLAPGAGAAGDGVHDAADAAGRTVFADDAEVVVARTPS
jgi:hypothetical protein